MVHEANTHLQTKRHGLIPAHKLLTILWNTLHSSSGEDIEISEEDRTVYRLLEVKISQIDLALKYINSCKVEEHMDAGLKVWNSNRVKKQENFRFFAIYGTVDLAMHGQTSEGRTSTREREGWAPAVLRREIR